MNAPAPVLGSGFDFEAKLRTELEKGTIPLDQIVDRVNEIIQGLYQEVLDNVEVVEFEG